MPLTAITKDIFLKALVGKNSMLGDSIYIGLSSTAPNEDGSGVTEPTAGGYARVLVGSAETQMFGESENYAITNTEDIAFPESTDSWGDKLTHFVFFNSEDAVIAFEELKDSEGVASPIEVLAAYVNIIFRAGSLTISLDTYKNNEGGESNENQLESQT